MRPERWNEILKLRLRSLLRRSQVERELDRELRFHLEQQAMENAERGMSEEEALFAARRSLGGLEQIQEECRDMRRTGFIQDVLQDMRYAARTLRRDLGFTAVIVLTMALAIGANSAIFSVIQGVLLKPLPYSAPDRLVRLFLTTAAFPKFPLNPWDFVDYRARARSFESMAAYTHATPQLSGHGRPVRLEAFQVTSGFFHVLGLQPAMGREFSRKEELPVAPRLAVISDRLWRTRLDARPDVIGQRIILDEEPWVAIGVMPPGVAHPGNAYHAVAFGESVDLWIPYAFDQDPANRGSHFMDGVARLKDGVTPAAAQAELNSVMSQMGREHDGDKGWHVMAKPLQQEITGASRPMLLVLFGAVGLVLLIACANAANLLLARATARQREVAIRAALGARRSRLIRQMLTESVMIALAGALMGCGVAVAGVRVLTTLLPADFPRGADIHVNGFVFLFTLCVAIATGLLFGLAPALQGSKTDLRSPLHNGSRSATSSAGSLRLRNALVVSEVALACVLLIGAGLMLRSLVNLMGTGPGFRAEHVLTASLSLPNANYKKVQDVGRFDQMLLSRLSANAGVQSAGVGSDLPWTGYDENAGGFHVEGEHQVPQDDTHARYHAASAGYFEALGIPVLKGRAFDGHDTKDGPQTLIINQSMAKRYWRNGDALGRRLTFDNNPKEKDWMTVVGIVGDVKDTPASPGAEPGFWWPTEQAPFPMREMSLAVRGDADAKVLADQVRAAVESIDPNLAVADIRTMEHVTDRSYATSRFAVFLVGLFAVLALVLAGTGTYGVIAYSVTQRSHEFGVRMALGARPGDVVAAVLRHGMGLALAGVTGGVLCGLLFGRLLRTLLYGVGAADVTTIAASAGLLLAASAIACYLPARRATASDPMRALRAE
jgi:predicted permease